MEDNEYDSILADDSTESTEKFIQKVSDILEEQEAKDPTKIHLLKNTTRHTEVMRVENSIPSTKGAEVIDAIISSALDNQPAKLFVGVQPLTAPVGTTYSLNYESKDEKLSLEVLSHATEATSRKLAHKMTMEDFESITSDDSQHGIEIANEIYQGIRNDLMRIAQKQTLDFANIRKEQFACIALITTLNKVANNIGKDTRRGVGNFVILSETMLSVLTNERALEIDEAHVDEQYPYVKYVGTISGTIKVYHDLTLEDDKIIIGYKGTSDVDTGYVYAPYTPVITTGITVNPNTFESTMGFATRAGLYINQPTEETTSEDGLTTTTTREYCNYYVVLTCENVPDLTKSESSDSPVVDDDLFNEALKVII